MLFMHKDSCIITFAYTPEHTYIYLNKITNRNTYAKFHVIYA